MFTICLTNLRFFAYHGIHEEEGILGNTFIVNAEINIPETDRVDSLGQTINYVSAYGIIKERMAVPTPLLETIAQDIATQIHALDQRIVSISLSIEKSNPPIQGMEGSVGIRYFKEFK
ncbi:MAG TPA: dihydroneopterin aldolase [Ferruginibacter sp.]|nr:dihydroneopterin aldolase [Ferruginibacter sp.]MBN8700942.1 dihydroneopterin aldolase [Chitinophagales bacterium]HMX37666.1 dihydroneopterin aldolase [Ferruginibacter sp.]HNA17602.1 dihydroneopterin aldolase [Ferruginibacter sp.]HNK29892.1 dihydroneopterin aldolase [Ferruginibacter sp.]